MGNVWNVHVPDLTGGPNPVPRVGAVDTIWLQGRRQRAVQPQPGPAEKKGLIQPHSGRGIA